MKPTKLGVLLSGSGTNFQAILDHMPALQDRGKITVVISNKANAYGLERARKAGLKAVHLPHKAYPTRKEYDAALVDCLQAHGVDWVILAGFMRIVTQTLLNAFPHRVVNIHPALLPSFKGLHGQSQAYKAKVTISGATVHLVTTEMDAGPIIAQGAVPVLEDDSADSLSTRILSMEHQLYPLVIRWICEGRLQTDGGVVSVQLTGGESRALFWHND